MPVRKIPKNYRNLTGILASSKSIGAAQFESKLERDFLIHLEFSAEIQTFEVQPVTIEWSDPDCRRRTYTPDVLINFQKEIHRVPWLCEIKYRTDIKEHWSELRPKFLKGIRYAKEHGWRFRLITDIEIRTTYLDNINFLLPFRSRVVSHADVDAILKTLLTVKTSITPFQLLLEVASDEKKRSELLPVIWYLVAHHRIEIDLDRSLTMQSPMRASTKGDTRLKYLFN